MILTTPNWTEATQAVGTAKSILIVTHKHPDGDAIGSMVGLANALRERGKRVDTAVDGGVPAEFRFIAGAELVNPSLESGDWSLMISVDASDEDRSGLVGAYGRAHSPIVINLDHHLTNTLFGHIHLILPDAASSSEVILHWLTEMRHPLTPQVAIPLMVGLVTDTRGFRTSSVTAATLQAAQVLMAAGASVAEISERVLESMPYNILQLWKYSMSTIELREGVISANLTQENLRKAGFTDMIDSGLVGLLISVEEAIAAILFKEMDDGQVGISMRSRPGCDVAQVALALGGGGHKQAAGATIPGPLETARERVLPMLHQVVKLGALTVV